MGAGCKSLLILLLLLLAPSVLALIFPVRIKIKGSDRYWRHINFDMFTSEQYDALDSKFQMVYYGSNDPDQNMTNFWTGNPSFPDYIIKKVNGSHPDGWTRLVFADSDPWFNIYYHSSD